MIYKILFSLILLFGAAIPSYAQWTRVADVREMVYSFAQAGTTLYVGGDTRVFRSLDAGDSWTACSPFPHDAEGVLAMTVWRNMLFAGTMVHGVFASSDLGDTWSRIGEGDPRMTVTALLVHNDTLYAGTDGSGIYAVGLEHPGAWRERNDGLFWWTSYTINTLFATPTHLLAGAGANGHIFRREAGTESWSELLVDERFSNDLTAYAFHTHGDALLLGGNAGIHRGAMDGAQWSYVGVSSLPLLDVIGFAEHDGKLYAAVQHGGEYFIAQSHDNGNNWNVTDHEFALLFSITTHGNMLYAAREDGLWKRPLNQPQQTDRPRTRETARIISVYPQPATSAVTVSFSIEHPGNHRLILTDLLGREIAYLSENAIATGTQLRSFNTAGLPPGSYVLRLEAAGARHQRTFTVVR
ncbi:MAG: T9SS type A sorting domain-containing protein [Bacteroidia bacterium]|nr:T9SS type A sorting domain-containing protein [Bacteroidia bacterium]